MNAERAAFMAALGITEEDVIDPDHHITSNTSKPSGRTMYKSHLTTDVNEKEQITAKTHDIECANITGKVPVHNSTHAISLSSSCSNGLSLSQLSSPKTTQTSFQTVNDSLHNTNYTYNYNTQQNTPTFTNTFTTSTSNNYVPTAAENDVNRSLHAQHKISQIIQVNKYETNLLPLTLTFHADMRAAEEMKQAGNVAFEVGDFLHSIRHYSHAIDTLTIYAETLLVPPPSLSSITQNILDNIECNVNNKKNDVNYSSMPTNVHSAHNGKYTNNYNCQEETHKDKSKHNYYKQEEQQMVMLEMYELDELVLLLASLHSNRSASFLQAAKLCESIEYAYLHALSDAEMTIQLRPGWFKGYSRQGDVYFKMKEYHNSAEAFAMAVSLAPENVNLQHSLEESERRARQSDCADRAHRSLHPVEHNTTNDNTYKNNNSKKKKQNPTEELLKTKSKTNTNIMHEEKLENRNKLNTETSSQNVNTKAVSCTRFEKETPTITTPKCTLSAAVLSSDAHLNCLYNNNNCDNNFEGNDNHEVINTVAAQLTHDDKSDNFVVDNNKIEMNKNEVKGQLAKKMWEEFKHEMEITSSTPTGDDYRKAQLAKFRQEQEQKKMKMSTKLTDEQTKIISRKIDDNVSDYTEPQILPRDYTAEVKNEKVNICDNSNRGNVETIKPLHHDRNVGSNYESDECSVNTSRERERSGKLTPPKRSTVQSKVTFTEINKFDKEDDMSYIRNKNSTNSSININDFEHDANMQRRRKSGSIDSNTNSVSHLCEMDIPQEFSSSAAAAYQQKLLAEYRKKKATHVEREKEEEQEQYLQEKIYEETIKLK